MNRQQLVRQIKDKRNYLCIGLDTDIDKIPKHLQAAPDAVFRFNKSIIDATSDLCVSYKINTAFYEAMGLKGWEALEQTVNYIPDTHFKIADAKRGDIGNTSAQYAKTFFDVYGFDALTVAPYMGEDSLRPFLEYQDKWTIVLGLTSNQGSLDFQQLVVQDARKDNFGKVNDQDQQQPFLYERVMNQVAQWGTEDNLMFVVGATKSAQLADIRKAFPQHFFLVPGVGSQGGSLAEVSQHGLNADGGLLVNVSRAVLYASSGENFAEEARAVAKTYADEMSKYI